MIAINLLSTFPASAQGPSEVLTVTVLNDASGEPLPAATVGLYRAEELVASGLTGNNGIYKIRLAQPAAYDLKVTYMGYISYDKPVGVHTEIEVRLAYSSNHIGNVVVTATESRGMTSSSLIGADAMEHLQPSSFSDLLELLPGGSASDPALSTPNRIDLRVASSLSGDDYATSSLGTAFVVDGAPISTNANMQYLAGAYDNDAADWRHNLNQGVDMRGISTDNIQTVEIVRGIASVEYGDLASGLVKIIRKRGGSDLSARFKSDMSSKLFYVGKAVESRDGSLTLNMDVDWLDYKADPRNLLLSYKRLNASARLSKTWNLDRRSIVYSTSVDYGGSFDNEKKDPDLLMGKTDQYNSRYNRYAVANSVRLGGLNGSVLRRLELTTSVSYEADKLSRTLFVQLPRDMVALSHREEGEFDGIYLPYQYVARHEVDGQPFNAFAKLVSVLSLPAGATANEITAGADWSMDKNYGRGQIFDPMRPAFPVSGTVRARKYSDIPARHNLSFFVEDYSTVALGNWTLALMAGVRASSLLNLRGDYRMRGKFYFDPRVNAKISFPATYVWGKRMVAEITGGIGWQTRFPTIAHLYPAPAYMDFIQLNYRNGESSRYNVRTYIEDPTNYALGPARNMKTEIRADAMWGDNRLSVTLFREDMTSGFRSQAQYNLYMFRRYSTTGIDLEGKQPVLEELPYEYRAEYRGMSQTTNGSRTLKEGIEFTFTSERIEAIRTRVTINGAWFRTTYVNSQPVYKAPVASDGNDGQLVGLYADDDGYVRDRFNTNFMADTDIPRLGLRFSLSFQCLWFTARESMARNGGAPLQYLDSTGALHDFTASSLNDPDLVKLVLTETSAYRSRVPFCMDVNLKATKRLFGDRMTVALFVNKLFSYYPDYKHNGVVIRRDGVNPYFGLEMNIKI